jgi:hypothetical protein
MNIQMIYINYDTRLSTDISMSIISAAFMSLILLGVGYGAG